MCASCLANVVPSAVSALEAALRGTQTVCGLVRRAFARGQHLDQDRPQARGRRLVGIELLQASTQLGGDDLEHGVGAANERDRQVRGAEDKRICCAGFHWASQEIGVGRGNVHVGLLDVPLPIGVPATTCWRGWFCTAFSLQFRT